MYKTVHLPCLYNLSVKGFSPTVIKHACIVIRTSLFCVSSLIFCHCPSTLFQKIGQVPCCMWLPVDISKPFCTSTLRWSWSKREHLGYAFFTVALGTVGMLLLKCGVVSVDCGQSTACIKSCTTANGCSVRYSLVHYFFVLLVLYQKHFLLLLLAF